MQFARDVLALFVLDGFDTLGEHFGSTLKLLAYGDIGNHSHQPQRRIWRDRLEFSIELQPSQCPVLAHDSTDPVKVPTWSRSLAQRGFETIHVFGIETAVHKLPFSEGPIRK